MELEKDIPLSPRHGGTKQEWPFSRMDVGYSFKIPNELAYKCRNAANSYSGYHKGVKFSVRKEGDHYRCWRIA